MKHRDVSRRTLLKDGGAVLAGLSLQGAGQARFPREDDREKHAWDDEKPDPSQSLGQPGDVVLPWLDQRPGDPPENIAGSQLVWEELDSWLIPSREIPLRRSLRRAHQWPGRGQLARRRLRPGCQPPVTNTRRTAGSPAPRGGLHPRVLGQPRLSRCHRPHRQRPLGRHPARSGIGGSASLEGRHRSGVLWNRWRNADDPGQHRDRKRWSDRYIPPEGGGLTIPEQFARSMSLDDALDPRNLLCYEMNGEALPHKNGFPVRLIAPGWYGVANVKWLTRIEVRDQRHAGNYMARDYVTIREEHRGSSDPFWTFSTVRHFRLKSAPAKVVRRASRHVVLGAAWGAPIAAVQVRIDDGPWIPARLFGPVARKRSSRGLAWQFWTFNWGTPAAGEHRVTSRAFDTDGNMQPAPNDAFLASKVTFWESNGHITRRVLIP